MTAIDGADRLAERLDWIRRVEAQPERVAQRRLRGRLRADANAARQTVRRLTPWPAMTDVVAQMFERDSELVRLHHMIRAITEGDRILDVGCGPGVVAGTLSLHHRLGAYLGVDLSAPKIESATEMARVNELPDLRFTVGDAAELPADEIERLQPNVVLLLEVLEHLQDPGAVLSSIASLAPPTARIIFSVPLLGRLESCWGHRSLYGADAILGLSQSCGLRILDVAELHNTWALATVTRDGADRVQPSDHLVPAVVHHAPIWTSLEVSRAATSEVLNRPYRVQITTDGGNPMELSIATPGARWLRIDIEAHEPTMIDRLTVTTVSEEGDVVQRWNVEGPSVRDRTRETIILRPSGANVPHEILARGAGTAARTEIDVHTSGDDVPHTVTLWRVGFASVYAERPLDDEPAARPSPTRVPPSNGRLRSVARRIARSDTAVGRAITARYPVIKGRVRSATSRTRSALGRARRRIAARRG